MGATVIRNPIYWFSTTNTPTGFPTNVEALPLGYTIDEGACGRRFRWCKVQLSGVSCKMGTPLTFVTSAHFATVSPDISDGAPSTAGFLTSYGFAGISMFSATPGSGSVAYGWVMTQGPLGRIVGSKAAGINVRTFVSSGAGISRNKAFGLFSTADGFMRHISTGAAYTSAYMKSHVRHRVNFLYAGAAITASTLQSVTSGLIHSVW